MKLSDIQIRDPFVLVEGGRLYLFGSTDKDIWRGAGEGFDVYTCDGVCPYDDWNGPFPAVRPPAGFWSKTNFWAPEVHVYGGAYYMFATFKPEPHTNGGHRGTAILRADNPLGPYLPWSAGPVTPPSWEALDGTLFVEEGIPYLVFCHEWQQVGDGEICAMPLSADLRAAAGEPVLLFRASEAPWAAPLAKRPAGSYVTDGPFLWRGGGVGSADNGIADNGVAGNGGNLYLLWSSFNSGGRYSIGAARSETGALSGPWRQNERPVYNADGGHGMVFRAPNGRVYLAIHSPNKTPDERAIFVEITEEDDTIKMVLTKTDV
jgi:hypothetical protein